MAVLFSTGTKPSILWLVKINNCRSERYEWYGGARITNIIGEKRCRSKWLHTCMGSARQVMIFFKNLTGFGNLSGLYHHLFSTIPAWSLDLVGVGIVPSAWCYFLVTMHQHRHVIRTHQRPPFFHLWIEELFNKTKYIKRTLVHRH